MADQEEKTLVRQILKKDEAAIKRFYQEHSPKLLRLIAAKVEKKEDAEEILQDTFLSIFDSLPIFNFRCSLLTWAKSIARHEIADFYRKRKIKTVVFSHLPFLENLVSQALGPELTLEKKELREEVEKAFLGLAEGYGKILRLKYIEGLTVKQIAKTLKLSFKSTESKLFRARLAFQQAWLESYSKNSSDFPSS